MKYLALIGVVAVIYVVFIRVSPVKEVSDAVTQTEAAPLVSPARPAEAAPVSNSIKRPLNRTHQVLDQVRGRNGNGEF